MHEEKEESEIAAQVARYYEARQQARELEQELAELRNVIVSFCNVQEGGQWTGTAYRARLIVQERRTYDDGQLYDRLPDPALWRLLSRADPAKINSLIKLKVLPQEVADQAAVVHQVTLLKVEKR